jgi:DNA-binding transcriptional LysR family regulator
MALEGHGLTFLPHSAVREALRAQQLVSALPADAQAGEALQLHLSVRAYRARPAGKDAERSRAQALWSHLQAQQVSGPV